VAALPTGLVAGLVLCKPIIQAVPTFRISD
jgi:hypothetical protein